MNNETRVVGELGVLDWLAADVVLPFRVFDTHIRYLDPASQQAVQIENPFLHHRNEVLAGPADPWLVARMATALRGFAVTARLGVTIPLGSTVENPFALGDMGLPHEHTQFGTGTFEPIAGIEGYRTFGGVTVDAYWLTIQSLYENGYGYKAGRRYAYGASAASALGTASWRFRAMLDRTSETAESWSGVVDTTEGNIGRTDVIAGLEAAYSIDDDWRAALAIKVPVYTHVVGGQVDTPLYVSLTISTHVHLWKPKRTLKIAGPAPDLAPVPGKFTAIDFWAEWCKPCHELDRELAEVTRRHPDDLVVHKIEVNESDFPLPHVKLFDRTGKLVWERSGAPPALAAAVEDAITGAHVEPEPAAPEPKPMTPTTPAVQKPARVAITVTDAGYTPARVTIPRGRAAVLVFKRVSEKTCAVDVHFTLPDGTKIERRLPLGEAVEIPIRVDRAAEIPYACGMDMNHGTIVVQ